ncbi:MAG: response regulator transcription factor [Proteobacteria bacterium]|nr:response regulator transcription factor [Pseudomonadota bacterium]
MSILIVDDAEDIRGLIKAILEAGGYRDLITADSANEAFKKLGLPITESLGGFLRSEGKDENVCSPSDIDLILLDIILPDMDGIDVCRRIKSSKKCEEIPIVMVTAKKEADKLESSFNSGAVDYIKKPLDRVELLARVRLALKLKKSMDDYRQCREKLEDNNLALDNAQRKIESLQASLQNRQSLA